MSANSGHLSEVSTVIPERQAALAVCERGLTPSVRPAVGRVVAMDLR